MQFDSRFIKNSVQGTATIYSRLVVSDFTVAVSKEPTTKAKKTPSVRSKVTNQCLVSLFLSGVSIISLKQYREVQSPLLSVSYINIPVVNAKVSIFNVINILTPLVGLYGVQKKSDKAIKLYRSLLLMDANIEVGSLLYSITFAKPLLYQKRVLLLSGVGNIVSPTYFHSNSFWTLFYPALLPLVPYNIAVRQLKSIWTAAQYYRELKKDVIKNNIKTK